MKQTVKSCTQVSFPNWLDAIDASNLNPKSRYAFVITIRWFLGYCKRTEQVACVDSIRAFLEWAREEKKPEEGVFHNWRKALVWFYKNAPQTEDKMDSSEQLKEPEWEKKLVNQMRIEHKALETERSYRDWCRRMVRFCFDKKPEALGNADIERFLDNLATEGRVSAATQRQALNALVYWFKIVRKMEVSEFLDYRKARAKKNLPVVMSQREIPLFLEQLTGTHQLMAKIQYGAGLRISDVVRLRVKDLDFDNGYIPVRAGKGNRDRRCHLPQSIVESLKQHLIRVKELYNKDREAGVPGVYLPFALARKYPKAGEQWIWQWVFPRRQLSKP